MFTISPSVNVSEIDNTGSIPVVSTSAAAIAGVFNWGPVLERILVTDESDLASTFHKPSDFNAETWFTAKNFLDYANQLTVVRVTTGTSGIAVFPTTTAPNAALQTVNNKDAYDAGITFSANVAYVAKYPGSVGNSLKVSVCDSAQAYNTTLELVANSDIASTSNVAFTVGSTNAVVAIGFTGNGTQTTANAQAYAVKGMLQVGDNILVGNTTIGTQYVEIASIGAVTGNSTISTFNIGLASPYRLHTNWSADYIDRWWQYHSLVPSAPGVSNYVQNFGNGAVDEMHVVVTDDGGLFTGVPGQVLEIYTALSRALDAKAEDGSDNFYADVINTRSNYLWWANDRVGAPAATAATMTDPTTIAPLVITLTNGTDGDNESAIAFSSIAQGYDMFADSKEVDVSLVLAGKARSGDGLTHINYLIDNVSELRKDCVTFASPPKEVVVFNAGNELNDLVNFASELRPSSYGFFDSGYKKQYDKYNDTYRWIPLNGDIAGLAARCDQTNDSWWSFAGLNRGQIKNVVKLAYNPKQGVRDTLSKNSINAVISTSGDGTYLFDDRTLLKKSSAFRAINVRRLFIFLEKSIATDAKYMLFEFNDEFTQAAFRNRTVPFLRDVMGRRGIYNFQVVCDGTNNTDEVVQSEQFVGDIYIKPARAIRGIQLNFIAVRGDVTFNESVGQF